MALGAHAAIAWPVLVMLLGCCTGGLLSECPRLCECKWKSGKESVLCINANVSAVPLQLEAGTQVLDLTGNQLAAIKNDEFSRAGLVNLQKVYVARCRLKAIERFAFRDLINLVELDLSSNALAAVPSHAFASIPEVRELKLSGNPIQRVLNDAFAALTQLVRLELSDCRIGTLEARAFAGLEGSLEWLKLDANRLVDVRSSTLTSLRSLHGLELAANPWNCSCALRPLREWMLRHNVPFGVPPVCKSPARLAAKPWDRLDLDEFACVPKILAPAPRAHGVEGRNVTMTCRIAGVPEPSVRWLLKNRVIANVSGVPYANGKKLYVVRVQDQSSNLTILTADVQDAGVYVCAAENKAGRVEASVTLAVSRRPPEHALHNKAVLAAVVAAGLFVLGSCLVVLCVCSVRRRQAAGRWQARRTSSGRRHDDSYEKIEMMNHKVLVAESAGGNGLGPAGLGAEVAVVGPLRRNGDYRGVPCLDTDQEDEDATYDDNTETPTPTNPSSRESKLWAAAAAARSISSPNSAPWSSTLCDTNLDPDDLHIPRRTKEETRDDCNRSRNSTFGTYREPSPHEMLAATIAGSLSQTLQPHVMRKQLLGEGGGSLYTSAAEPLAGERPFPDLLDTSADGCGARPFRDRGNSMDASNLYCTLPRLRAGGARYRSCDSESPLLPESRYGSSGGDSSDSSRRYSDDSYRYPLSGLNARVYQKSSSYLSLASTRPSVVVAQASSPNSTPLLDVAALEARLESHADNLLSPSVGAAPRCTQANPYDYHAAQLERFLEEYRSLQQQLSKMKETCDSLRQEDDAAGRFLDPLHSLVVTPSPGSDEAGAPRSILKKVSPAASPWGGAGGSPVDGPFYRN